MYSRRNATYLICLICLLVCHLIRLYYPHPGSWERAPRCRRRAGPSPSAASTRSPLISSRFSDISSFVIIRSDFYICYTSIFSYAALSSHDFLCHVRCRTIFSTHYFCRAFPVPNICGYVSAFVGVVGACVGSSSRQRSGRSEGGREIEKNS